MKFEKLITPEKQELLDTLHKQEMIDYLHSIGILDADMLRKVFAYVGTDTKEKLALSYHYRAFLALQHGRKGEDIFYNTISECVRNIVIELFPVESAHTFSPFEKQSKNFKRPAQLQTDKNILSSK